MSSVQPGVPSAVPSAGFPVAPPPASLEAKPLSQIERVVDTFFAPTKTFRDILRNANCWLALVLIVLSSLTAAFMVDKQVGFERVFENNLQASPKRLDQFNSLAPEQKARQAAISVSVTRAVVYALPVFLVLAWLIYALVVWALFNFVFGASTRFSQVFAVAIYAALPYLLMTVLLAITLYLGGSAESYDSQNPVGTNPAYYLPGLAPWLKALLMQLDLIKLWSLALAVLGMATISRKSMTQSAVIVGGLWLLGVVVGVGVAAFS